MGAEKKEKINTKIRTALRDFKKNWKNKEKVYEELCYCILTPQSSARGAMKCIKNLKENNLLESGTFEEKEKFLKNVRFYKTKAKRLEEVQKKFPKNSLKKILLENGLPDAKKARKFLLKEVNGFGMKEASHFLRNIGFFEDIAILDRHILKNLVKCGVIKEVPKNLNEKKYLEIEEKMKKYCEKKGINFAELDLLFWSNETGEVLK